MIGVFYSCVTSSGTYVHAHSGLGVRTLCGAKIYRVSGDSLREPVVLDDELLCGRCKRIAQAHLARAEEETKAVDGFLVRTEARRLVWICSRCARGVANPVGRRFRFAGETCPRCADPGVGMVMLPATKNENGEER